LAKRSNRVRVIDRDMVMARAIRWTLQYTGGMLSVWPKMPTLFLTTLDHAQVFKSEIAVLAFARRRHLITRWRFELPRVLC